MASLVVANAVWAKTIYISPGGSDSEDGSFSSPYATVSRAIGAVSHGDTIVARGGTYVGDGNRWVNIRQSGTPSSPIVFKAYGSEEPVFDGKGSGKWGIRASWWVFENLRVTNFSSVGFWVDDGASDNVFEDCRADNCYGSGFQVYDGNRNLFVRCLSRDNDGGGDADGFGVTGGPGIVSKGNHFLECVAINNSDDGFDTYVGIETIFEKCVARGNGYNGGDGNGFKMGGARQSGGEFSCKVIRCIALDNTHREYDSNGSDYRIYLLNCVAYDTSDLNYRFYGNNSSPNNHVVANCISMPRSTGNTFDNSTLRHDNSWQTPLSGKNLGLISTTPPSGNTWKDYADSEFFKLRADSICIDAGKVFEDVSYNGDAPDVGAWETDADPVSDLPVVWVDGESGPAAEPGGYETRGVFRIYRDDSLDSMTVKYTLGGTAANGVDYTFLSGEVFFTAGEQWKPVTVDVLDDLLVEGKETVTLTLISDASYDVASPDQGSLRIEDDDFDNDYITAQAEDAFISGGYINNWGSGSAGDGYVDLDEGGYVEWVIEVPTDGFYDLDFTTTGAVNGMAGEVMVNNVIINSNLPVANGGSWRSNWSITKEMDVPLYAGTNIIRFTDAGYNQPQLDQLQLVFVSPLAEPDTIQAEDVTYVNGYVNVAGSGWNGTGYVDLHENGYVEWTVDVLVAGIYDLDFSTTGAADGMTGEVMVDGVVINPSLPFPNTGSWNKDWEITTQDGVFLEAGMVTVRLTDSGTNQPQLDQLTFR